MTSSSESLATVRNYIRVTFYSSVEIYERLQRHYYSKNPYMLNGKGSRYSILERQGSYFVKIKLEAVSVLLLTYCFTFFYLVSIQYNPIWNNVYNWRLKQMYRCLSGWESIRICSEHFNTVLLQNKLHISFRFELNKHLLHNIPQSSKKQKWKNHAGNTFLLSIPKLR